MDARPTPVTARFLRTPDAAVHLGLSARTLEKHRCFGTGPVYRKLGGRIVYAVTDLDAWAEWTCTGFVPVSYLTMPPWLRTRAG